MNRRERNFEMPQRLKKIRELFNMPQFKLANKIGVSRNTIGNYETGVTMPNDDILTMYSKIYKLPQSYFENGVLTPEELLLFYFNQLSDDNKDNIIKVIENHKNVKLLTDYILCAKK